MTEPRSVIAVGIAASALEEAKGDPALQRALHEDLLEELAVHGQLTFTSREHLQRFVAVVRSLPTSLSKAWEAVLSSKRVSVAVLEPQVASVLSDVLDASALDANLAPKVRLVLLEAEHAELLGVADDEYSALSPAGLVEIGRITTASRTAALLAAREVLDAPMRAGVNREVEWQRRLGPLCASSSPVVIYDKFVGQQVVRRYIYQQEQSGDGLTWLLSRIAGTSCRRVRVITSVTDVPDRGRSFDEDSAASAFRLMMQQFPGDSLRLDLVLVPERVRAEPGKAAERFGHDRHIRFGDRVALALGVGIQAFATGELRETTSVARLPIRDARDREERAIRTALRPPEGGWLAG